MIDIIIHHTETKMKKRMKVIMASSICLLTLAMGCGKAEQSANVVEKQQKQTLNIAYQYGLAYAPLMIAQEENLIEEAYRNATGNELEIEWIQMSSGADISNGLASGTLDAGFVGIAPAITGTLKNVGFKVFTNLSGQEHGMMSNDENIRSFEDLVGSSHQIALVNIGSIQHIILAKALVEEGYDAHSLDSNIVAMKHPDGMSALESKGVKCHLTSSPYIHMEREKDSLYELESVANAWTKDESFIVGVAAEKIQKEDSALYQALCDGIAAAIDFINTDVEGAAETTCEYNGNSLEDEIEYLKKGNYSVETKGLYEMAVFMYENGFVEREPAGYSDLVFDNVKGD